MPQYLAVTNIKAAGPDGLQVTILAGNPIVDFEQWGYEAQMAALRLGHVKEIGGMNTANLTTEGGYLHYKQEPAYVDPAVTRAHQIVDNDPLPASLPLQAMTQKEAAALPPEGNEMEVIEDGSVTGPEGFGCTHCDKVCKTAKGLDKHIAAAHP